MVVVWWLGWWNTGMDKGVFGKLKNLVVTNFSLEWTPECLLQFEEHVWIGQMRLYAIYMSKWKNGTYLLSSSIVNSVEELFIFLTGECPTACRQAHAKNSIRRSIHSYAKKEIMNEFEKLENEMMMMIKQRILMNQSTLDCRSRLRGKIGWC